MFRQELFIYTTVSFIGLNDVKRYRWPSLLILCSHLSVQSCMQSLGLVPSKEKFVQKNNLVHPLLSYCRRTKKPHSFHTCVKLDLSRNIVSAFLTLAVIIVLLSFCCLFLKMYSDCQTKKKNENC